MSTSSSAAPCTPERVTPRRVAMTRSFTVPPKLTVSTRTNPIPEIGAADGIETLYVHPSTSIIKFTTGGSRPTSSSESARGRNADGSGTLPWAYPTESTVAVGPMEIYRVPGSVSFLHSGALLHAILPRSQCWCVDGISKFAFRVLPETYYRIELPGETAEDMELVEALKVTLKKVLFYERTPCPFARGFTVDLPVEEIKVKKRNSLRGGPAKKWRLEKTFDWKPEGWEEEEERKRQSEADDSQSSGDKRLEPSDEEGARSDQSEEYEEAERPDANRATPSKLRPPALVSMRSMTAPSQVPTQQTFPSRVRSRVQAVETVDRAEKAEKVRFSAEVERRSSVRAKRLSAIPVDLPPSPPDSSAGIETHFEEDEDGLGEGEHQEDAPQGRESADDADIGETVPVSKLDVEIETYPIDKSIAPSSSAGSDETGTSQSGDAETSSLESKIDLEQGPSSGEQSAQHDHELLSQQFAEASLTQSDQHDPAKDDIEEALDDRMSANTASDARATGRQAKADPYAAIQARIQARRSIGGSASSVQSKRNSTTSKNTSSNTPSVSIASQRSNKSTLTQHNQSVTAALVNKACAVFLGPPAHLVTMMLRIAARFSSGAFGSTSMFFVESPAGSPRRIPGSFYLEDEEEQGWESEEEDWDDEDDFGVPLKSPVRISGMREQARRRGWEME